MLASAKTDEEKGEGMTLRLNGARKIENLRGYDREIVAELRNLLATGAQAQPDPRRPGFYDIYDGGRVYFIHISPVSGNVVLLATWCESNIPELAKASACRICIA
jgi:hypothetical protein